MSARQSALFYAALAVIFIFGGAAFDRFITVGFGFLWAAGAAAFLWIDRKGPS